MPRDQFIALCSEFLKEVRPNYIQDWKNIGISCDWSILYSTIDSHSRKIAQWSFLDLYKKKRIYRKDAPAMWCPECKTGVAQVEVRDKEMESLFNDVVFHVDHKEIIIATTRPELLPACVAVFFHPGDKRFISLKGKKAKVPLFDFEVPIMEDMRVDPEKGTGIVMCCTFGDQVDMEWQKAYNLPIKTVITETGEISDLGGSYKGMRIKQMRKAILKDLQEKHLLKKQIPIKHMVNTHERCGTEIEFIKSKQWFVKYLDLKEEMLAWGKEIQWHPEYMRHRYENWIKGLQWDWLISNQRYFGVAFPVWYCEKCYEPSIADEQQLPVDPEKDKPLHPCVKCKSNKFIPEKDVLNTWFTSSMTPQIAIQLVNKEAQKKLFPMDLRPQAHEIITFWLFNTVVKSRLHYKKNPWKHAALSGFVTFEGEKMSKSKGNIVRPQEVMEKYGADAIRYWAASSKLGEDFAYYEKDVVTGKKTVTKLENASKFVMMHLQDYKGTKPKKLELMDAWLLAKLNILVKSCTKSFEQYEYSKTKFETEQFFWSIFCDNYLEIVKDRIYNKKRGKVAKISAQYTLVTSLLTLLKLFAPFMPYITEEIYQQYFAQKEKRKSIHISSWPKSVKNDTSTEQGDLFLKILSEVRQFKAKNNKSLKVPVQLSLEKEQFLLLQPVFEDLQAVTQGTITEGTFGVNFI